MSPPAGDPPARPGLQGRLLVVAATLAVGLAAGALIEASPYDAYAVPPDVPHAGVPARSVVFTTSSLPAVGDLATFTDGPHGLAFGTVETVHEQGAWHVLEIATDAAGAETETVPASQVTGTVVGHVPLAGTPWLLPPAAQAAVVLGLTATYLGLGARGSGRRRGGGGGLLGPRRGLLR